MSARKKAAVILAAGLGTRMNSALPKVLHEVAGRPMIGHLIEALDGLGFDRTIVVTAPQMGELAEAVAPASCCIQDPPLGTAHAVLAARQRLAGFTGDVVVLFGDTPLLRPETIEAMVTARRGADNPAVVVLGFRPADPGAYGRLVLGRDGTLDAIVEARDATPTQLAIPLCNAGIMALDGARMFALLDAVDSTNAKGEFYLTDIIALARARGWACAHVVAHDADEVLGVNSRADLATAEAVMQTRLRRRAMDGGVTLIDPSTVYLSADTEFGRDVVIGPNVFIGPGVSIADNVAIRSFCHIEQAEIGVGAIIGPFARLRPGARIGVAAHIGNFVEIKAAVVEEGAKINHLSYIGDARVGARANIGAGTITCNYDGFFKYHTDIGAGAFIGSNTALVAPVKVGDGAIIGAGTVVAKDVPDDALALTRADHVERPGWATAFRTRKRADKEAAAKAKRKKAS